MTKEGLNATIKAATASDLPIVAELAGIIWREHYPGIITYEQIDYMLERSYALDVMINEIENEGVKYDLIYESGAPIGFVAYGPAKKKDEMKIHKLYLLGSYHGKGYGSLLLQHALSEISKAGGKSVILQVNKHNNKAIEAYFKNGFIRRDAVVVDIGNGFVMDDYIMEKHL